MMEEFIRISALLGHEKFEKLQNSTVAVFGIGGVGGAAAEALIRSGVGTIHAFDSDTVAVSNLNRQAVAFKGTVGKSKTAVLKEMAKEISDSVTVIPHEIFYSPETADEIDLKQFDFIIDAIDTVTCKTELIARSSALGVPIISVMGTANKLDPLKLTITDIYKTEGCPLARAMRTALKKRGVKKLTVIYSTETPIKAENFGEYRDTGRPCPASAIFVPAAAGLIAAQNAVKYLTK
jgi:tRNA A37 threonylcarbamoyladenosine dehydratase